jgi:uncharacterized repeat protein (TIGR01451 family)
MTGVATMPASGTLAVLVSASIPATSEEVDPNPANDSAVLEIVAGDRAPAVSADVGVAVAAPGEVRVGDAFTLKAVVTNHGPGVATGVTLMTPLPQGAEFVSASATQGTCRGGRTVVCELGSLSGSTHAEGDTATVSVVVRAMTAAAYELTSTVATAPPDPDAAANNHQTVVVAVVAPRTPKALDTTPPHVRAFSTSGKRSAPVRLRFTVSDNSGRAHVTWRVAGHGGTIASGQGWYRSATTPYTQARRLHAGSYTLTVRATDGSGNTSRVARATIRVH